jgi:RNA polymerase sigma factor (sigma-70 family)
MKQYGPATRPSLLLSLRDTANDAAWQQFSRLYLPLVFNHCVKRGLQEADAADVAQEVLRTVAAKIRDFDYDPDRGSFRSWLFRVVHNKLKKFFTAKYRHLELENSELRLAGQDSAEDEGVWEMQYRQRLFDWAVEQVRDEFKEATWQAFWLTSAKDFSVKETAEKLGMSNGAVYIARSRVLARLREVIERVEEEPWRSVPGDAAGRISSGSGSIGRKNEPES